MVALSDVMNEGQATELLKHSSSSTFFLSLSLEPSRLQQGEEAGVQHQ